MSEHTPTPWMYSEVSTQGGHMFKVGSPEMVAGKHGAICLYDDRTSLNPHADGVQHANAAFIVRACNSHEALVEAGRQLVIQMESMDADGEDSGFYLFLQDFKATLKLAGAA